MAGWGPGLRWCAAGGAEGAFGVGEVGGEEGGWGEFGEGEGGECEGLGVGVECHWGGEASGREIGLGFVDLEGAWEVGFFFWSWCRVRLIDKKVIRVGLREQGCVFF